MDTRTSVSRQLLAYAEYLPGIERTAYHTFQNVIVS